MLCAALPPASATTAGTLLIDPGTGGTDTETQVTFRTPVACATSTHARVTITGAGFPDDSPIVDAIGDPSSPVAIPLGGSWNALAEMLHAPIPLVGTALVVLVCSNPGARTVDKQFSAQVNFTPTTGRAATYSTEALAADADPTPTPTPTAPPPTPEPTPSPAPADPAQPATAADLIPPPGTSPGPSTTPGPDAIAPPVEWVTAEPTPSSLTLSLIDAAAALPAPPEPAAPTPSLTPLLGEDAAGSFTFSVDSTNGGIALSPPEWAGPYLVSTGQINPVTVRDTRTGGPGWSVSVQVSDFASGLSARYLGWTPFLLGPGGGAVPGASIASGYFGGNGLLDPRELASAGDGHAPGAAVLGAALDLRIPHDTAPGIYQTTLTITALS